MIQLTPDGYAIVMKNSKSGILDLAGNVILPIEYDYIYKPKDTLEY
jgi:hypothetical protein